MDDRDGRGGGEGRECPGPPAPEPTDPFAGGVPRRQALRASAAGTTAALAGCPGGTGSDDGDGDGGTGDGEGAPTVYVSNTGDATLSVIDADADELLGTVDVGAVASFPANQYGTAVDDDYGVLWFNVSGGVEAYDAAALDRIASVETGHGPNYPNLSPDGDHLLVAAGGTTTLDPDPDDPENHRYVRIDADPESDGFGDVTGEIETGYVGPCDVTLAADGEHAFGVDINGEALRVLRVDPFETVAEVDVGDPVAGGRVLPFMCTASFAGDLLFVENGEGELGSGGDRRGSEAIWDVSDPRNPEELARLTREDGLPGMPITSEVGPGSETAYLFVPGAGVTVVDVADRTVVETLDVGGAALAGAWGPRREKLYVPVQDANHVAVVDNAAREVTTTVDVGEAPTGAVGGMVRPAVDGVAGLLGSLASLGVDVGRSAPTYCPEGHCYCGHLG